MEVSAEVAKAVVIDVLYAGGIMSSSPRVDNPGGYMRLYFSEDCKKICNGIIDRTWEFYEFDDTFNNSSKLLVNTDLAGDGYTINIKFTKGQLFNILAGLCKKTEIYWDDVHTTKSVVEMETYRKSMFGKALWNAGCFLSQAAAVTKSAGAASSSAGATPSATAMAGSDKFSYKASGSHLADIPNSIGETKETFAEYAFCIIADKLGKNTPNAFITPLKINAKGIVPVSKAYAEHINFGSGNGWTDCQLWFKSAEDAKATLELITSKFDSTYSNIRIVKTKPDNNGYFKVSTECGEAYIKAHKLNEELNKALTEAAKQSNTKETDINKYKNASYSIEDIDVYEEAYARYDI